MASGILAELSTRISKLRSQINQLKISLWNILGARWYLVILCVAVLVYGLVFSWFTVMKHNAFQSYTWDLGVFNQAMYTTVHSGKFFYYTADLLLSPSGCYFAQKISPILFTILPFYALNSSPITLLIFKSFILALGAFPLYLLSKELLKSDKASLVIAFIYLLYAPLQGANGYDFQPQVFLPFIVFFTFYFALKSNWKLYFLSIALAAMVIEQMSLFVFMIGLYLLISSKVRPFWKSLTTFRSMNQNLASAITITFSALYYLATTWIKQSFPINPDFMSTYKSAGNFAILGLGGDPLLLPGQILMNPQRAFEALLYDFPLKFLFIILLFGPLLFLCFKSKLILLTFPFLAIFLLSNYKAYYTVGSHYPLYLIPIIFVALLITLKDYHRVTRNSLIKTMFVVSLIFTVSISPLSPLSAPFVTDGTLWYPGKDQTANLNIDSLNDLVNAIPPNASILTQNNIFPHVSNRLNAYVLPVQSEFNDTEYLQSLLNESEYVLLDLSILDDVTSFILNDIAENQTYGAYALGTNAILFKRGFQGEPLFAQYAEYKVLTAYKDLLTSPFNQIINDSSATSEKVVLYPKGTSGFVVYGPYTYLLQGSYEVTYEVKVGEKNDSLIGGVDVSNSRGNSSDTIANRDIFGFELQPNEWTNFTTTFTTTKFKKDFEFRVFSKGITDMYVDKIIMKRTSSNATTEVGLKTLGSNSLLLASGNVSATGVMTLPQNTISDTFWFGPYMQLSAGKYKSSFLMNLAGETVHKNENVITLRVTANSGKTILAEYEVNASDFIGSNGEFDWHTFTLNVSASENLENVEFTGYAPSSNFTIYLAHIVLEPILSLEANYREFSIQKGLQVAAGQIVSDASSQSGEVALSRKGLDGGILTFGPYVDLPSGNFEAIFRIKTTETAQTAVIVFDVCTELGTKTLVNMTLNSLEISDGSWFNVTLPFSLQTYTKGIEFRTFSNGVTNLYVDTVTLKYP